MPNYFVTFSPHNDVYHRTDVLAIFDSFIHNCLADEVKLFAGTTSEGSTNDHFHFHIHIINYQYTKVTLRKHLLKSLPEAILTKMTENKKYILRIELQKGKMTEVYGYLLRNHDEGEDNKFHFSAKYEQYIHDHATEDKILNQFEYFKKLYEETERYKIKQNGLDMHLFTTCVTKIEDEYFTWRIDDFTKQRIHDSIFKKLRSRK